MIHRFLSITAAGTMLAALVPITTRGAGIPRPEHPRPDRFRENWVSLNGEWQFEIDQAGDGEARGLTSGKNLITRIVVPFCPESKLSGIGHYGLMKNREPSLPIRDAPVPPAEVGVLLVVRLDRSRGAATRAAAAPLVVDGLGDADVFFKISADGMAWPAGLGGRIPGHHAGPWVTALANGRLLLTSCSNTLSYSDDHGRNWHPAEPPASDVGPGKNFTWPAIYQTENDEVAVMVAWHGVQVRFGTIGAGKPSTAAPP